MTYSKGFRIRHYIRRDQVENVRKACEAHRELQSQLRAGRVEYKRTLARTRELAKMLLQ